MTLEFLTDAQAEFYEAAVYYEDKEVGLGKRFRAEVWEICSAILSTRSSGGSGKESSGGSIARYSQMKR